MLKYHTFFLSYHIHSFVRWKMIDFFYSLMLFSVTCVSCSEWCKSANMWIVAFHSLSLICICISISFIHNAYSIAPPFFDLAPQHTHHSIGRNIHCRLLVWFNTFVIMNHHCKICAVFINATMCDCWIYNRQSMCTGVFTGEWDVWTKTRNETTRNDVAQVRVNRRYLSNAELP